MRRLRLLLRRLTGGHQHDYYWHWRRVEGGWLGGWDCSVCARPGWWLGYPVNYDDTYRRALDVAFLVHELSALGYYSAPIGLPK